MNTAPDIHVTSFAQLLAYVPYLLGWRPRNAVVVAGLDSTDSIASVVHSRSSRVGGAFAAGLPPGESEATSYILIGYFDADCRARAAVSILTSRRELESCGLEVREVLLVTDGHWSASRCRTGACDHDNHDLPTALKLVVHDFTAIQHRNPVAGRLDPVDADRRHAAEQAFRTVAADVDRDADTAERIVVHAVEVMQAHGKEVGRGLPAVDDIAVLAAVASRLDVVDGACRVIDADGTASARRYLELWRWVVRHLPGRHGAAAAALCAYAAWRAGDGVLADEALRRCVDRKQQLAVYMADVLRRHASPHTTPSYT